MYDLAILGAWVEFAVRWVHVITAIAWIGSSFYFIALDLGLWRDRDLASGADGEEWQVHGGGFYHIQKYLVAPEAMPEPSDLVQMGKLCDLAVGRGDADAGLLAGGRALPDRPDEGRPGGLAGRPDLGGVADHRLAGL